MAYDDQGQVTSVTRSDGLGTPWRTAVTAYAYSAMGDVLSVDGPHEGDTVFYRYNRAREQVLASAPIPTAPARCRAAPAGR
jgi:hypothetical protein